MFGRVAYCCHRRMCWVGHAGPGELAGLGSGPAPLPDRNPAAGRGWSMALGPAPSTRPASLAGRACDHQVVDRSKLNAGIAHRLPHTGSSERPATGIVSFSFSGQGWSVISHPRVVPGGAAGCPPSLMRGAGTRHVNRTGAGRLDRVLPARRRCRALLNPAPGDIPSGASRLL